MGLCGNIKRAGLKLARQFGTGLPRLKIHRFPAGYFPGNIRHLPHLRHITADVFQRYFPADFILCERGLCFYRTYQPIHIRQRGKPPAGLPQYHVAGCIKGVFQRLSVGHIPVSIYL